MGKEFVNSLRKRGTAIEVFPVSFKTRLNGLQNVLILAHHLCDDKNLLSVNYPRILGYEHVAYIHTVTIATYSTVGNV